MFQNTKNQNDPRPECKYSDKCYQKNSEHLKKYKHPPPKKLFSIFDIPSKRRKLENPIEKCLSSEESGNLSTKELVLDINKNDDENNKEIEKPHSSVEFSDDHLENFTNSVEIKYHSLPDNVPNFIEEKFLVSMPGDFYSFWELYQNSNLVKSFIKLIRLKLVGPFDVLLQTLPVREKDEEYLLHWRFYFDPPEFQTIIVSSKNGYHFGYYRDSPSELPCFVASNDGENCKIIPVGENIFAALISYAKSSQTKSLSFVPKKQYDEFIDKLSNWAKTHNFEIQPKTEKIKNRQKNVVSATFHGAGIVVPYDKKSQLGYRRLSESDLYIKKILQKLMEAKTDDMKKSSFALLQSIITMANIATDECDFGTGLELGIDLFCYGDPFLHNSAKGLLSVAYQMLNRDSFQAIIKIHLENRRKGYDLSAAKLS